MILIFLNQQFYELIVSGKKDDRFKHISICIYLYIF